MSWTPIGMISSRTIFLPPTAGGTRFCPVIIPFRRSRREYWIFLLLREMISLDENGQMVPTHVVESVQFRARSHTDRSGVEHSLGREAELSRALLFQGRQGGLR